MTRLLPVHRPSEARVRHRGVQEQPAAVRRRVDTNVASDRHTLPHGSILGQAHQNSQRNGGPKLFAAAADDDGSVRPDKERKKTPVISARSRSCRRRPGRLHISPLANRSPIALSLLSRPPLFSILSPTNEPTVPDGRHVSEQISKGVKGTKKALRDLAAKVPPKSKSRACVAVYSTRWYIKYLHYTCSVEKDPIFFSVSTYRPGSWV
jgi:hypothetical protein